MITKFPIKNITELYCASKNKYECEMYGTSFGGTDKPLIGFTSVDKVQLKNIPIVNIDSYMKSKFVRVFSKDITCDIEQQGSKKVLICTK